MNRVTLFAGRPFAVAIVFLCLMALTFCQILGPTARLNLAFGPTDLAESVLIASSERATGPHSSAPVGCAAIKLAPVEMNVVDFAPVEAGCEPINTSASRPPVGVELGVPTPPPREV
jgi:hypothetical protein